MKKLRVKGNDNIKAELRNYAKRNGYEDIFSEDIIDYLSRFASTLDDGIEVEETSAFYQNGYRSCEDSKQYTGRFELNLNSKSDSKNRVWRAEYKVS